MAFSPETYGAVKKWTQTFIDKKITEAINVTSLGYVTSGGHMPTTRLDGSALQVGDYVKPANDATYPFTIDGVTFTSRKSTAYYVNGGGWQVSTDSLQLTSETPLANKSYESISGTASFQSDVNIEFIEEFDKKENLSNKLTDFDNLVEGDLTSYPNADAVKKLADKKIEATRKVAGITLENDITIQQLIDAFKDVARTYKNVTFDCDDNTLRNILVSHFKAGEVLSTIGNLTTEEYKLATAKAVFDFVRSNVQGAIKIKGSKATLAEIEALTDMQANDEWFCEADSHFYLYTDGSVWMDMGGGADLTTYIQKSEIVNNLTTNDSQKPLSAGQGKVLKDLVDTKQDIIDLVKKGAELRTLNPNITFTNAKLNFLLDMSIANIEATLNTPKTNLQHDRVELLRLPTPPKDYAYPSRLRIETTKPSGYWTCEENRHEFFDEDGQYYVDPLTFADNKEFNIQSVALYNAAHDYYSDNKQKNKIYVCEQLKNAQNQPIVNLDGSPFVAKQGLVVKIQNGQPVIEEHEDTLRDRPFVLKYTAGQGYTYHSTIYDKDGNAITGNFYECVEVPITIDMQYIYYQYIYRKMIEVVGSNFIVDSQGRLCKVEIEDDANCKVLNAKNNSLDYFRYINGYNGTIAITPLDHSAASDQIVATIEPHEATNPDNGDIEVDYYSVYSHGSNVFTSFNIQRAF